MDGTRRLLMESHKAAIVEDLDVNHIIDYLISREAITGDDVDHIFSFSIRTEQVRAALDVIVRNGANSHEAFVESLAKDYRWLWEKFQQPDSTVSDSILLDSIEDSLSNGGVPRYPSHYVKRDVLEERVRLELEKLKRHSLLVLHGMSGCGKTSLGVSVLRNNPQMISQNFNGIVFWINVGDCRTEEQIIAQQVKLHWKARSLEGYKNSSVINTSISLSSMGSLADSQSLTSMEQGWPEHRDTLKYLFGDGNLREALLVLDDLCDKRVAEAFDIGCKQLITTKDSSLVSSLQPLIVNVESNFTESESLLLFASCLERSPSQLPKQARKLHEICRGAPLLVSLLGAMLADNKEKFANDKNHWNYYVHKMHKKDFKDIWFSESSNFKAIEMCVNSLPPNLQVLYKKLAVLPNNVMISSQVLSTIWQQSRDSVDGIMKQLKNKSLIIEIYDMEQTNYLYDVHDLIMSYLRSCFSETEMKKLHSELLNNYSNLSSSESIVDLPDDGYIAYYIGYHIFHTQNFNKSYDLFHSLYLNLKFLGNKVRLTGPADVITDIDNYGKQICRNAVEWELLYDLRTFLGTHGSDLYRYPCTDLHQSVLQHTSTGALYHEAYNYALARQKENELYFEFHHENNVEDFKYTSIDTEQVVCCAAFFNNYVLVGTLKGTIEVFDINTNACIKSLVHHSGSAVRSLSVYPGSPARIASLTSDGALRIWCMDDIDNDTDHLEDAEYITLCGGNETCNTIDIKNGPYYSCQWSNNSECLLTNTMSALVIYDTQGAIMKVYNNWEISRCVTGCWYSADDTYILMSSTLDNLHFVNVITAEHGTCVAVFTQASAVLQIIHHPSNNNCILILTKHEVARHNSLVTSSVTNSLKGNTGKSNDIAVVRSTDIKCDLQFTNATVNGSGTLLFVSTNDCRVICIDLKTHTYIFDLDNRRGSRDTIQNYDNDFNFRCSNPDAADATCLKRMTEGSTGCELVLWSQAGILSLNSEFQVSAANNIVCMDSIEYWNEEYSSYSDLLLTGTGSVENCVKVWLLDASYVTAAHKNNRKARFTSCFDSSFHTYNPSPGTPAGQTTPPGQATLSGQATPSSQATPLRLAASLDTRPQLSSPKKLIVKTRSLDRHSLKPLNLMGINNLNMDCPINPILAIVDDNNNIQILRGRRLWLQIQDEEDDQITAVKISPCNQYVLFGSSSGTVRKFTIRNKEIERVMNLNSPVHYLEFMNPNLLIAAAENHCLMSYKFLQDGTPHVVMLLRGTSELGSQELLNDMTGFKKNKNERAYHVTERSRSGTQSSGSEVSGSPKADRTFPLSNKSNLCRLSPLVKCVWLEGLGMMTVENNGTVKLWDLEMKLKCVLVGRQIDLQVTCAAFDNAHNILVLCDRYGKFQIYQLKEREENEVALELTDTRRLNNEITCCDIAKTYHVLAMGLDSGNIVLWHIRGKYQIMLLQLHKSRVQYCAFSPPNPYASPSAPPSPAPFPCPSPAPTAAPAPLVLTSVAGCVVWWDIGHALRTRDRKIKRGSRGSTMMSPFIRSPTDPRSFNGDRNKTNVPKDNYFFGDGPISTDRTWEYLWRGKRCKEGSKRQEVLACIKLSGENAAHLMIDQKFSCFVTVDRSGTVHIMSVLRGTPEGSES